MSPNLSLRGSNRLLFTLADVKYSCVGDGLPPSNYIFTPPPLSFDSADVAPLTTCVTALVYLLMYLNICLLPHLLSCAFFLGRVFWGNLCSGEKIMSKKIKVQVMGRARKKSLSEIEDTYMLDHEVSS